MSESIHGILLEETIADKKIVSTELHETIFRGIFLEVALDAYHRRLLHRQANQIKVDLPHNGFSLATKNPSR